MMLLILGFALGQEQPRIIDSMAIELLRQSDRQVMAARSLTAAVRVRTEHRRQNGEVATTVRTAWVWLQRPNQARIETSLRIRESTSAKWVSYPNWSTFVSDGSKTWRANSLTRSLREGTPAPDGRNVDLKMLGIISGFFDREMAHGARIGLFQHHQWLQSIVERGMIGEAEPLRSVGWRYRRVGTKFMIEEHLGLGKELFPISLQYRSPVEGVFSTSSVTSLRVNPKIEPKVFQFSPPRGFRKSRA